MKTEDEPEDDKDPASICDKIVDCPLHKRTPFGIQNVSMTQFSVARHYGGATFNGDNYIYFPEVDELIRTDVVEWMNNTPNARRQDA